MERKIIFNNLVVKRAADFLLSLDLFNALPDWVWVRDLRGRILDANEAALKRTGYAKTELVGKELADFYFDERERPRGEAWIKRLLQGGSGYSVATISDKAGKPIEVEQHGRVIDLAGEKAVLIVARDIGQQLRDRRLSLTLYEAFRRSNDVMFYTDRDGTILDVNEAFTKHYGFSRDEAVGKNPRILQSRHSTKELYKKMWDSILTKGHWRGEMINKAKDGREIPLILTITAVRDQGGEIIGHISNAVDMTEHMALRSRLADTEALASLGEMAAVVAHEIRNPLGSIVMAAQELAGGQISAEDREVVMRVLKKESHRLNVTLTNFLAFARPRELKLEKVDLNGLIDDVLRMAASNPDLVGRARLERKLAKDMKHLQIDPDQIRQIVWNLVINALQALGGKGRLTVRTGRRAGRAFFSVADDGPGIPEKLKATLFKPFQTSKQQGTGLGLAIADRVVKAHGGEIAVETGPVGTTFTVSLPSSEE